MLTRYFLQALLAIIYLKLALKNMQQSGKKTDLAVLDFIKSFFTFLFS